MVRVTANILMGKNRSPHSRAGLRCVLLPTNQCEKRKWRRAVAWCIEGHAKVTIQLGDDGQQFVARWTPRQAPKRRSDFPSGLWPVIKSDSTLYIVSAEGGQPGTKTSTGNTLLKVRKQVLELRRCIPTAKATLCKPLIPHRQFGQVGEMPQFGW